MKSLVFLGLFTLIACAQDKKTEQRGNAINTELKRQNLDVDLLNSDIDKKFQVDVSSSEVDLERTALLNGTWTNIEGNIQLANSTIKQGGKIVFKDTAEKVSTGWGTIFYTRTVKIYFTEFGSHLYEYYVDGKGLLNLIQVEYRNNDLSFKEKPDYSREQLKINWLTNDLFELLLENQKAALKKVETSMK